MFADIIEEIGESVTVVRLAVDKDEIIASKIMCVLQPVDDGKYENWKADIDGNFPIRKGDILIRDDGSELQVLRIATQRDPIGGDITQLDLKDYDRQEPPLQENEVERSEPDLPEHELHPLIAQKVWSVFLQGDYDPAVFQAFKQVEVAVRNVGNYEDADIGVPLMRKAFHADTGNLTNPNQQPAEQEAIGHLFAGAMGYCRNSLAHREVNLTAEEAVEMIFLASYLLRIVDSCEQSNPNTSV